MARVKQESRNFKPGPFKRLPLATMTAPRISRIPYIRTATDSSEIEDEDEEEDEHSFAEISEPGGKPGSDHRKNGSELQVRLRFAASLSCY
jgi:hypothetical protein